MTNNTKEQIIRASDEREARSLVERKACAIVVLNHTRIKHDTLRALDTIITPVIARLAAKQGITFGIDIGELRALPSHAQARELARIQRAIEICRKARAGMAVLHASDERAARTFLLALGASTQQAAHAQVL